MNFHLSAITLDQASMVALSTAIAQEREVAVLDLLDANSFRVEGSDHGPYELTLGVEDGRLLFDIKREGQAHARILLSLAPLRSLIRDYWLVCENYYKAIRTATPQQVEALDAGRKALHDEGATELRQRLQGRIETDFETARRLYTLICVLQLRA
ncbi:MAG: UPF0262 family protein [Alphaproteobacteria bacterium]|nr:UPF0262 family protein [Alphaproteobacteria bacterium]